MKRIFHFVVAALAWVSADAQSLPPVWQGSADVQYSSRTIAYLSPTRIVWQETTGSSSIEGIDKLLLPGNGQAELVGGKECVIRKRPDGKVSFLLDFGRELQGGIQIVTGQSSRKEAKVRIRFGESVSEAMCDITPENGATFDGCTGCGVTNQSQCTVLLD